MTQPYYSDDHVSLFVGDWRELIAPDFRADLILTDPPYGETSLAWDDGTGPHGIDNPKARPHPWKRRDSDRRSRHDISDLRAVGLADTEIAHRLGIQPESLQRRHAA